MKDKKLSRRGKVRVISFMFATLLVTGGFAVVGWMKAFSLKTQIEYSYIRALSDLETYVTNIDASLEKCLYAGTNEQAVMLSARVWREAGEAKTCLAALPYSDNRLDSTEKFLSQVGEYAYSLSLNAVDGSEVSKEDYETLRKLSNYANQLSMSITGMVNDISENNYTVDEVEKELSGLNNEGEGDDRFTDMEATFEDYPTLIYDGPYSDHLTSQKPKLIEGQKEITPEEAKKIAADFINVKTDEIKQIGEQEGNLPLYEFSSDDTYIAVTKMGGIVSTLNSARNISATNYGVKEALNAAEKYLQNRGIADMKYTYYLEQGDKLAVNFAYEYGDAVCYTDLIKVYVALDDLSIVGYEAEGYIINHTAREIPQNTISVSKALESVSKYLTVQDKQTAFIRPNGLNEYYTYEFKCQGENNRQVLVYIDAVTGAAVDMLLLIDTAGGTLTI